MILDWRWRTTFIWGGELPLLAERYPLVSYDTLGTAVLCKTCDGSVILWVRDLGPTADIGNLIHVVLDHEATKHLPEGPPNERSEKDRRIIKATRTDRGRHARREDGNAHQQDRRRGA